MVTRQSQMEATGERESPYQELTGTKRSPCAGLQPPPGSGAKPDVPAPWTSTGHAWHWSIQIDGGWERKGARGQHWTVPSVRVLEGAQRS